MNKKSLLVGALAGIGAAAWLAHRNKKYPLAKGYALLNKFSVPGAFVCAPVSALGNAVLQKNAFAHRARRAETALFAVYGAGRCFAFHNDV